MQMKTKDVKSKTNSVGIAEYPAYDSTTEAVEDKGEDVVLSLINAQVRTNAMNLIRSNATGKVSKKALMQMALATLTVEDFASVAGDTIALQNLLDKKGAEIQADLDAKVPTAVEVDEDEDD